MIDEIVRESLNIRYVKLHFTIMFPEDSVLPVSKTSAIRGGIGQMMLNANCIADRNCEVCDFASECIVQRAMYTKFDIKPEFVTSGESVGYVFECENYDEFFPAGSSLRFNLILFGKTICYFAQYMQAIYALGQTGLGKNHSRFVVEQVTNTIGENILHGENVYMEKYKVSKVLDYVEYRMNTSDYSGTNPCIKFKTPLTLKYRGEFLKEFNMEAIIQSLKRRIYMLDCFEGIECKVAYEKEYDSPWIVSQDIKKISTKRYSSRQDSAMTLKGVKGEIYVDGLSDEILPLLYAGELVHIGKNTSFGFGRYRMEDRR